MHRFGRGSSGINVIMADGSKSKLPYRFKAYKRYTEIRIPEGAVVRRVKMWGSKFSHVFNGVKFYDAHGNCILEAGNCPENYHLTVATREFTLLAGERILGVKSQLNEDPNLSPWQIDLIFTIGHIE